MVNATNRRVTVLEITVAYTSTCETAGQRGVDRSVVSLAHFVPPQPETFTPEFLFFLSFPPFRSLVHRYLFYPCEHRMASSPILRQCRYNQFFHPGFLVFSPFPSLPLPPPLFQPHWPVTNFSSLYCVQSINQLIG